MKRLGDDGEGSSPLFSFRLPKKTAEQLDKLIASLPPNPIGPPPKAMVIRAVVDAGIEALAISMGIKLDGPPKPINREIRAPEARCATRVPKVRTSGSVHPSSRARAERRAEARSAAGCKCGRNHLRACKLYKVRGDEATS